MTTPRSARRGAHALGEIALTVGALLGVLCVVVAGLALVLDVKPLIFRSGSMTPTIQTGALAVARSVPASDIQVGDVVSVVGAGDVRVTHRVTGVERSRDRARLTLKGDANEAADPLPYDVASADRVLFDVPRLGYVLSWLSGPAGAFLAGMLVVVAVLVIVRRRPTDDGGNSGAASPPGGRGGARKGARSRRSRVVSRSTVAVVATVAMGAPAAAAGWIDTGTATSGTFSTTTIAVPANFRCGALGVLSVTFSWDAVPGATSYTVHYGAGGALTREVTTTSTTFVSAISGGTAWVRANRAYTSTTWTSAASSTRSYTVAVVSLCS
ncbi:signal peptidase I [Aeromicrobium stalagmiti]|uniref:signal peptidase I n=1 Tax=Aeromicrobium stalagmiti TaxID=2738988 RepID=UPI00156939CA|nr:signal peptidase I [Aeromicrobium stalagmiti]NRQ50537.1 signal peptidase I [Aeromicrobium stalagmiti]